MPGVTWVGNTENSKLKEKYDLANSKLENLRAQLQAKGCSDTIIDDLKNQLDEVTQSAINSVQLMSNRIKNTIGCFVSDEDAQKLTSKYADGIKKTLEGNPLTNFINKIDETTDNIKDKNCDEINSLLDNLKDNLNQLYNKVNNIKTTVSTATDAENDLTKAIAAVAGFLNCVNDTLLHDEKLGDALEMVDPALLGTTLIIRQNLTTGKSKTEILKKAQDKLISNLSVKAKYQDAVNSIKNLFD